MFLEAACQARQACHSEIAMCPQITLLDMHIPTAEPQLRLPAEVPPFFFGVCVCMSVLPSWHAPSRPQFAIQSIEFSGTPRPTKQHSLARSSKVATANTEDKTS